MTRLGLRVRAWWAALTAVLLVAAGGAIVLPAAPVQAAPVSITCEPGVVYSVSQSGQIREISGGSPKNVGDAASRVSNFNGLGIGPDGSATYAYERNFNWWGFGNRSYRLQVQLEHGQVGVYGQISDRKRNRVHRRGG
ncbi:hypothetical protein [Brevibacterium linens]|uniref:hypothetical protein n=1 Tax=Brevibacterium linens TaxID=1703 RepID=UPI0013DF0840|nr:hypothetical protein [Brevibacterium linens]